MKKILSLDGGGIRGIIPAMILSEIERNTGKSICDMFDLIAGTSTGGILALGLTVPGKDKKPKFSAADMMGIYEKDGRKIFSRSFWKGVSSLGGWADELYDHKPLEEILDDYFGNRQLRSALTNVLISSYEIVTRTPFFFKSWRKNYNSVQIKKIGRATSAAPTIFEPYRLEHKGMTYILVDGGVFVNNPAVSAFAEARRIFPRDKDLLVVSLGTGQLTRPLPYEEVRQWGKLEWVKPVIDVVLDGVSDAVDYQLDKILGDNFYRFQAELNIASDDMDNASRANIEALKHEARHILNKSENKRKLNKLYELLV